MNSRPRPLEELIKDLPPDLREEVRKFAEVLIETKVRPKQKHLRMDWAGVLREYRDQYTALELQKKALEWMTESCMTQIKAEEETAMERIEEKFERLPQALRQEVSDFIDFLLSRDRLRSTKKPILNWIGGLKEYRDQFTTLELQKKASEWRD